MKYRKKPVVIEAVQHNADRESWDAICEFAKGMEPVGGKLISSRLYDTVYIPTLEGVMTARRGDWIIKGVAGEFYLCKPDIFEMTYEKVEE